MGMKKRLGMAGVAMVLAAALAGCGENVQETGGQGGIVGETQMTEETKEVKEAKEASENKAAQAGEEISSEKEPQKAETDAAKEEPQASETAGEGQDEEIKIPELSMEAYELPDSEALAFVHDMKIGWNLGNTLDASSDTNKADEMAYESDWCGIVTTKEMIDAVKEAGFRTVRVPVSWHNHVSDDGNYIISDIWMDRVQEVVDYAIDNDMYVIINIHHDNNTSYVYPSAEYIEQSKAYVAAVWEQVAERFAEYGDRLLMEGLNEPRLVGTQNEWWLDLNNQDCVDAVKYINELNQIFVDTVRASGGNNGSRYLLVPGYCASLQGATNEYFKLPQDVDGNENKILVEVHAYTPYSFALQGENESGSTDQWSVDSPASTSEIDDLMNQLYYKYIKNGVGVVIDEFAARDKGNNTQARTEYAAYYIAAARARGITCCWWDNHAFTGDGENMGLLRRRVCEFLYPELLEGMMRYCE